MTPFNAQREMENPALNGRAQNTCIELSSWARIAIKQV